MPLDPPVAAQHPIYTLKLGEFHNNWSSLDLRMDWAIGKFLGVTHGQTHLITSGMMFGRKARLLADLIGRSDHPRKAQLLGVLNKIRAEGKRDVITHSYVHSDSTTISFLERAIAGEFKAKMHTFTLLEFSGHVSRLAGLCDAFEAALGVTQEDLAEFAEAALSLDRKSKMPPGAHSGKE